jgi:stage V sporulation protein K
MRKLIELQPVAKEISALVGLKNVKHRLFDMVMRDLVEMASPITNNNNNNNNNDKKDEDNLRHIAIMGEPGSCKTTLARLVAKLFLHTGRLSKGKVVYGSRSNMIGCHVGETAIQTKELVLKAIGGVLVIDEVYSFKGDVFAVEAMNTLNQLMSEYAQDLMVIVVGYEEDIRRNIFGLNKGLERRFAGNMFHTKVLTADQLVLVFHDKILKSPWRIEEPKEITEIDFLIRTNSKDFVFGGADMVTLINQARHVACGRVWRDKGDMRLLIKLSDIEKAHKRIKASRKSDDRHASALSMYQ